MKLIRYLVGIMFLIIGILELFSAVPFWDSIINLTISYLLFRGDD